MKIFKWILWLIIFTSLFSLYSILSSLFFSGITGDLFEDLYVYADSETKDQAISLFSGNCEGLSLSENENFLDICGNATSITELKSSCREYEENKNETGQVQEFEDVCPDALSGRLDESCREINARGGINFIALSETCTNYTKGNIDNKTFFVDSVLNSIPSGLEESLLESPIVKINNLINLIFLILLIPALVLFYYVINDSKKFLKELGSLFFIFGLVIVFSYLALKTILYFGIDTSSALQSFVSLNEVEAKNEMILTIMPFIMNSFFGGIVSLIFGPLFTIAGFLMKKYSEKENLML